MKTIVLAEYPKKKEKKVRRGRYEVDYDLIYEGGGGRWSGRYRTRWLAKLAIWYNMHLGSYGGSAVLKDLWG